MSVEYDRELLSVLKKSLQPHIEMYDDHSEKIMFLSTTHYNLSYILIYIPTELIMQFKLLNGYFSEVIDSHDGDLDSDILMFIHARRYYDFASSKMAFSFPSNIDWFDHYIKNGNSDHIDMAKFIYKNSNKFDDVQIMTMLEKFYDVSITTNIE